MRTHLEGFGCWVPLILASAVFALGCGRPGGQAANANLDAGTPGGGLDGQGQQEVVDGSKPTEENAAECAFVLSNRPPEYAKLSFFEKLTFASGTVYKTYPSLPALAADAHRVFVGNVAGVEKGQYYPSSPDAKRCERRVQHTTNLVFAVKRDVRGSGPARVRVEWPHSRFVFAADLEASIPMEDVLVIVQRYMPIGPLPPGTPPPNEADLFNFATPLGLIMETTAAGLSFPLEPVREHWLPFPGSGFAEVVHALEPQ